MNHHGFKRPEYGTNRHKILRAALLALIARIDDMEQEYPDAHTCVCLSFNLTTREGELLTEEYDACDGVAL